VLASFNHMASRLREDRSKMEEYISSLEKVNRKLRLPRTRLSVPKNWPPSGAWLRGWP